MRALPAVAVLTGALVLAAGCSGDPAPSATAAPPPAAPGSPGSPAVPGAPAPTGSTPGGGSGSAPRGGTRNAGDAALAGNTGAICAQAEKTGGAFAATFAQDLKLLIDAASADDPDLAAKAEEKTRRDVQNYSFALKDLSRLAADRAVAKALGDMSKQVTALEGDVRKLDDRKLAALRGKLDQACGTG
ncbi:hypothetical protein [Jidongwangia harbinensis]|uniref:hypothetical protein n=1 Tax=Jidongwangia harbinensis TaxID=2878561 RepID=UPI001CDA0CFD|nr:hypothetical protein [Jidongwangia harbinensis]MCA2217890.1 hypothetical protein [Jidongwangia harbinensis]